MVEEVVLDETRWKTGVSAFGIVSDQARAGREASRAHAFAKYMLVVAGGSIKL